MQNHPFLENSKKLIRIWVITFLSQIAWIVLKVIFQSNSLWYYGISQYGLSSWGGYFDIYSMIGFGALTIADVYKTIITFNTHPKSLNNKDKWNPRKMDRFQILLLLNSCFVVIGWLSGFGASTWLLFSILIPLSIKLFYSIYFKQIAENKLNV